MGRVIVGLSGGVDSAVAAALLKEKGYEVTGVFIKIWQPEFIECTWREDRLDAMRVCAALGIPYQEIDLSEEYKREVVEPMVADYARGITPNPDVLCNRMIKFGSFAQWAHAEGAEYIATGHYARIERDASGSQNHYLLKRGKDRNKDQSYFLYQLGQRNLAKTLFPLGRFMKHEVRALARAFKLPNANKSESQGLCFVGEISMKEFLTQYIDVRDGKVIDITGKVIGRHSGAALYTIGQRHGFIITDKDQSNAVHYVTHVDTARNTITVSRFRDDAMRSVVRIENIHWIGNVPRGSFDADVQARYRETPVRAHIDTRKSLVAFGQPHLASIGQSLVIYSGEICLGGGVIR